jgi:hypothetical protein
MNRSRQPTPSASRRTIVSTLSTNMPYPSSATARTTTASAMYEAYGANRPGGRVAPSRTAAIGGTFVARTAGASPATRVTKMPMNSETTIVRVARIRPVVGKSLLNALKSAFSPSARPTPSTRPVMEASSPIVSDSIVIEPSSWRREAPIVRSVASSRMRCATVIDSVLKMTNAPTKSAIPAKERRK